MDAHEFDLMLGDLETRVDRLRALYENWFRGYEKAEPAVARKEVERKVYAMRKEMPRNTALRFRYNQLYQRYTTLATYWQRTARQIEEGTYRLQVQRMRRRNEQNAPPREGRAQREEPVDRPTSFDLDDDDSVDIDGIFAQVMLDDVEKSLTAPGPHAEPAADVLPKALRARTNGTFSRPRRDSQRPDAPEPPALAEPSSRKPPAPPAAAAQPQAPAAPEPSAPAAAKPAIAPVPSAPAAAKPAIGPVPSAPAAAKPAIAPVPSAPAAAKPAIAPSPLVAKVPPPPAPTIASFFSKTPGQKPAPPPVPAAAAPRATAFGMSSNPADVAARVAAGQPGRPPVPPPPSGLERHPPPPVPSAQILTPVAPTIGVGGAYGSGLLPPRAPSREPKPFVVARPSPEPPPRAAPAPRAAAIPGGDTVVGHPPPRSPFANEPALNDQRLRRLYEDYASARKRNNEGDVRYEAVVQSIQKMLPDLEKKHAGKRIDFEVVVKDGRVGLKPKAT